MIRISQIALPLDHTDADLESAVRERLGLGPDSPMEFTVFKRSHDARRRRAILLVYIVDVRCPESEVLPARLENDPNIAVTPDMTYHFVTETFTKAQVPRPVVIGMGPCGLFAALILAEMGLRPLVLERGKKVRERTIDTFGFWRGGPLDPESNVQFGEGGAGTFSDGKLYSQVRDNRYLGRKVLTEFVEAGAPDEILWSSRPHIGTFRLVKMVESLRTKIESLGGEIRFGARVEALHLEGGEVRGLVLADGEEITTDRVVLAVGHSARDTFEMLFASGVQIDAKSFSIGFRIEHPQSLIDRSRFGPSAGHPKLGAADYRLAHHCNNGRSVYSFCMCPGGTVVAAASEPGRVVTNGMSQYDRSERNANSGIVVGITPEDYPEGPLAGIALQRRCEEAAFLLGGSDYRAPAQRLEDFVARRPSTQLGEVIPSYTPGVTPSELDSSLPPWA
ncbi:MAG: FAD-dependent oxidoreductase, partial [Thermoanaerobaculia bacterium]|nr:FAD-dependent oxidoreductase [Thermoanaerobaculia bacterium]